MTLKKRSKGQKGFTLIELVSVVIILGILAAVVVPKYFDMTGKAQDGAYKGALNEGAARFNMAYAQYIMTTNQKPTDLNNLIGSAYLGSALTGINIGDYNLGYTGNSADGVTVTLTGSTGSALTFSTGSAVTRTIPWPQ